MIVYVCVCVCVCVCVYSHNNMAIRTESQAEESNAIAPSKGPFSSCTLHHHERTALWTKSSGFAHQRW